MQITRFSMTYHRNGVGGQGGFWCAFEAPDDNGETRRFMGWLWHGCRDGAFSACPEDCERDEPNEAAIVLLSDMVAMQAGGDPEEVNAWRGSDYFLPAILPHYRQAHHDWQARAFGSEFAAKFYPVA